MKLEDQVCALCLAKRLKELGVEQESLYHWIDNRDCEEYHWIDNRDCEDDTCNDCKDKYELIQDNEGLEYCSYSAFTVAELGEHINWRAMLLLGCPEDMAWFVDDRTTEADSRAKMLIHLIKKGYKNAENQKSPPALK